MISRYHTFWEWFQTKSEYIYTQLEKDTDNIALDITEHIKKVHPDIEFEIPFDLENGKRVLILSADGDYTLFPIIISFQESAPHIDKWEIVAFRPRLHQKNQIIDLDGISMDYDDIYFTYQIHNSKLHIDTYIRHFDGTDNRHIHLYFLLLDSLIGEYDSVTMIEETKIYPYKENQKNLLNIRELLQLVDTLKK